MNKKIYVFENPGNGASIVYDETSLTNEEKEIGIAIDALPEPPNQPGKIPILKCSKETGQVWYDYVDKPGDPIEDRIATVEDAIAELIMGGVM